MTGVGSVGSGGDQIGGANVHVGLSRFPSSDLIEVLPLLTCYQHQHHHRHCHPHHHCTDLTFKFNVSS